MSDSDHCLLCEFPNESSLFFISMFSSQSLLNTSTLKSDEEHGSKEFPCVVPAFHESAEPSNVSSRCIIKCADCLRQP